MIYKQTMSGFKRKIELVISTKILVEYVDVLHKLQQSIQFETLDWVDWFNNQRLLELIGNIPLIEFEDLYYKKEEEPTMMAGLKR